MAALLRLPGRIGSNQCSGLSGSEPPTNSGSSSRSSLSTTRAARSRDVRSWIWFWIEAGSVGVSDRIDVCSVTLFLRGSSMTTADVE